MLVCNDLEVFQSPNLAIRSAVHGAFVLGLVDPFKPTKELGDSGRAGLVEFAATHNVT
jgi:hypothetical protein